MYHTETHTVEHEILGPVRLVFYDETTLYGNTENETFCFLGEEYGNLSWRASLQTNGRWRISSFDLRTRKDGYCSTRIDGKDPKRKQLMEAVRDLISQWWALNDLGLSRRMLQAHEEELISTIAVEETRLDENRRLLSQVRSQLQTIPADLPESDGPSGETINSLLDLA